MQLVTRLLCIAALGLAGAGCAPATSGTGAAAPVRDSDVLSAAQMEKLGNTNLLQAVQALRPHWLSVRGMDSLQLQGDVVVFRDGVQLGGPASLSEMQTTGIASLRYFNGPTAAARWGLCCGHGVIYVSTLQDKSSP